VQRYFYWSHILLIVVVGVWFMGAGIPLAALHAFTWGPILSRRQAEALRYWLDGTTLRVDVGVYFLKRKAIPLDRVTDFVLAQGPLMRWCGIWAIHVQTAGAGQNVAEAMLYGVRDAERVRDELVAARDRAVRERTREAG
jgi:membrane protein YdbS with pleckstrin-like domain